MSPAYDLSGSDSTRGAALPVPPSLLRSGRGGCICRDDVWRSGRDRMAGLVTRVARASVGAVKDARSVLAAGGLRRVSDRDGVWPQRRRHQRPRRWRSFYAVKDRPSVQSADRPRRRSRGGSAPARSSTMPRWRSPGVVAGTPLTLVLPKAAHCPVGLLAIAAGLDTIAVRVPSHPVAQRDSGRVRRSRWPRRRRTGPGMVSPHHGAARAPRPW